MTNEELYDAVSACIGNPDCDMCLFKGAGYEYNVCTDTLLHELRKALLENVKEAALPAPTRQFILNEAERCVCGQRAQDYGELEYNFGKIAVMWSVYTGSSITPSDVAAMMGLLKIARIAGNEKHMDNWVDLAGYAACGGEIAGR